VPTAVLIDGGYFVKRYRAICRESTHDAARAADLAWRWAMLHMREGGMRGEQRKHELYRIFFYDCPPLLKKLHNPLTGKVVDFSKTDEARFRIELHERLRCKRKVALRMGHLSGDTPWTLVPSAIQDLLKKKRSFEDLSEADLLPNVRQKGVDMRIGIDIASLAFKRQVDQIVLVAGDADFVPAAKLARREGIDFILDPMWRSVDPGLNEHIDGLRSTCTRPPPKAASERPNDGIGAQPA
jgi:uncharacterized LabA/DUF88 family protein